MGNASEIAMIKFVQPFRDVDEYRASCPNLFKIPFNSKNKYQVCHRSGGISFSLLFFPRFPCTSAVLSPGYRRMKRSRARNPQQGQEPPALFPEQPILSVVISIYFHRIYRGDTDPILVPSGRLPPFRASPPSPFEIAWVILREFKFNNDQVHVVKQEDREESLVVMKGAPERIIDRCSEVLLGNRVVPMTPELRVQIESHQETLSRNGLRVLG